MPARPAARTPHIAAEAERLSACVHCGFCLTACPTYELLADENDSPRGRLYLMRAALEGRLELGRTLREHLDRCLGCRACESACPAGVEYGALLEAARADLDRAGLGEGTTGRILLWTVASPARARAAFGLLRILRDTGLLSLLGRLPGVGRLARSLLATRPAPELAAGRGRRAAVPPAAPEPAGDRGDGASADGTPATYALLEGCVMAGLFGHVHRAARRTLRACGYAEVRAPGQACCGALHAHAGRIDVARRLARRNVSAFERSGARWIATDSAGCGAALREYGHWLSGAGGDWAARGRAFAGRVRDVTELLRDAPRPRRGRLVGSAVYDAPCHLLHAQRVETAPLEVLERIEGLSVHPLPSWRSCCGGAGSFMLRRPRMAGEVLAGKLEEIRQASCDWVATGNPGCVMQIGSGIQEAGSRTSAVHPVELLDAAFERAGHYEGTTRGADGWS